MTAIATFDAFGQIAHELCQFAPDDVLRDLDLPDGKDMLSPQAIPADPSAACLVGVIDHAIPFAHRLLTCASGHSRVAAVWMIDAMKVRDHKDIAFGQYLRGVDIDHLRGLDGGPVQRDAEAIYRALGLIDPAHALGCAFLRQNSHGAAVAGTAAGYDPTDTQGLAHPLIGVSLPNWALADTAGTLMPLLIQAAVCFIIGRARLVAKQFSDKAGKPVKLPLVINLSLGISAGSRDGHSLVERLQDQIAANPPPGLGPVHFVLSTGNSRQEELNAVLAPGDQIGWQILPDDRTPSELQIWSGAEPAGQDAIKLRLTLPDGRHITSAFHPPKAGRGQIARIRDGRGYELARLILQGHGRPGNTLRQSLTVIVPPSVTRSPGITTAPTGEWQVRLLGMPGSSCDLVIQRDDRLPGFPPAGRQSHLVDPAYAGRGTNGQWLLADPVPPDAMIRRNGTCSAFAWGQRQLRCGAAMGPVQDNPTQFSPYTSLLADGVPGDLVATGDRGMARRGVLAPGMRGGAMQRINGTSIAAPRLTRWLAAQLAAGAALDTRAQVIDAARAQRPGWADPPRVDPAMPWRTDD